MYTKSLLEFHRAFGHYVRELPNFDSNVPDKVRYLRRRLMREELDELLDAMDRNDVVEIADGVADLLYVVVGTAVSYGIDADRVFEIVHAANMAKLGPDGKPVNDAGGKTMKPAGWVSPNDTIREYLESMRG